MMKKILLSFLLVFIGLINFNQQIHAKSFTWFQSSQQTSYQINFDLKQVFKRSLSDSNWIFLQNLTIIDNKIVEEDPERMEFIHGDKMDYIVIDGSGIIYQFSKDKKVLSRYDMTIFRGYNYDSYTFFDGQELKNLGGYHDGIYNLVLTFFDSNKKQWEAFSYKSKFPLALQENFLHFNPDSKTVYAFDLYKNHQFPITLNRKSFVFYELNLANLTWQKNGILNNELFSAHQDFSKWMVRWLGNILIVQNANGSQFVIDLNQNAIYKFQSGLIFNPKTEIFLNKNDLVIINFDSSQNVLDEKIIPIKLILSTNNKFGKLFTPVYFDFSLIHFYFGIEILCLLIIGFLLIRYFLKKHRLFGKGSNQELQEINFSPNVLSFFQEVKKDPNKEYYTTNELNEIIQCSNKAFDTQRQYRSRFVTELEEFISLQFGFENGIIRLQDQTDKRCIYYQINPQLKANGSFKEYLNNLE